MITPQILSRNQILTAIELLFLDGDIICSHILAGSARETLERENEHFGNRSFTTEIQKNNPHFFKKNDVWIIANKYRDLFKHFHTGSKKYNQDITLIKSYKQRETDFLIFVAIEEYSRLKKQLPIAMQVFQAWFYTMYPLVLSKDITERPWLNYFPEEMSGFSRYEAKKYGLHVLINYLIDEDLLHNPLTEDVFVSPKYQSLLL